MIKVGDKVQWTKESRVREVLAVHGNYLWLSNDPDQPMTGNAAYYIPVPKYTPVAARPIRGLLYTDQVTIDTDGIGIIGGYSGGSLLPFLRGGTIRGDDELWYLEMPGYRMKLPRTGERTFGGTA